MQGKVVGEEGWVKHGFTCPEQRISVNTFAERISRMSDLVSQRLQKLKQSILEKILPPWGGSHSPVDPCSLTMGNVI